MVVALSAAAASVHEHLEGTDNACDQQEQRVVGFTSGQTI